MLAAASVAFTDKELRPTRHAGRGGLGAVMGSKGLKAIVVNPEGGEMAPLIDPEAFKEAAKRFAKALTDHPVTSGGLPTYGTDVLINVINEAGGLPPATSAPGVLKARKRWAEKALTRLPSNAVEIRLTAVCPVV